MAYITGSAANFADLKTAIENACTANGWTLSSGILSKNNCFFKLVPGSSDGYVQLQLFGGTSQTGTTLNGQPPSNYGAKICSNVGNVISFPINYEIHLFTNPDEVYCIINYNLDFYQQLSFGKSDVPGVNGTGAWFTGAKRSDQYLNDNATGSKVYITTYWPKNLSISGEAGYTCGLFFDSNNGIEGQLFSSFVHTGLDATPWRSGNNGNNSLTGYRGGSLQVASLLMQLPNLYNNANVLLPIKPVALRSNGGVTIIVNPKNARYLRIDNVASGEIITFGAEKWKCYPFYRKDASARNGSPWPYGTVHSGTFGYAIKYTGS